VPSTRFERLKPVEIADLVFNFNVASLALSAKGTVALAMSAILVFIVKFSTAKQYWAHSQRLEDDAPKSD
jgi:hypothetical protein